MVKKKLISKSLTVGAMSAAAVTPPVLKEQGSFFVNGEVVQTDNPGGGNPRGRIVVNQMYVEYAIPLKPKPRVWPVIMVHGSGHTGKTYDTTPDGRDGWKQHFLRNGYSSTSSTKLAAPAQAGTLRRSIMPKPKATPS